MGDYVTANVKQRGILRQGRGPDAGTGDDWLPRSRRTLQRMSLFATPEVPTEAGLGVASAL
jgi:hypothetical protein